MLDYQRAMIMKTGHVHCKRRPERMAFAIVRVDSWRVYTNPMVDAYTGWWVTYPL